MEKVARIHEASGRIAARLAGRSRDESPIAVFILAAEDGPAKAASMQKVSTTSADAQDHKNGR